MLCSSRRADKRLVPTVRCAAAQTRHKVFFVRDGESLKYSFIATGEVSAHIYVTPGFGLHARYSTARKERLRQPFVTEAVEITARSIFVDSMYV